MIGVDLGGDTEYEVRVLSLCRGDAVIIGVKKNPFFSASKDREIGPALI